MVVQEIVNNLQAANGIVNKLIVMGAAEGMFNVQWFNRFSYSQQCQRMNLCFFLDVKALWKSIKDLRMAESCGRSSMPSTSVSDMEDGVSNLGICINLSGLS